MIASLASRVVTFTAIASIHVVVGSPPEMPDILDELSAYPAFQRGLRKYRYYVTHHGHHRGHNHGHLRASGKPSLALVHHHQPADIGVAAPRLDWHPDDAEPEAATLNLANADEIRQKTAEAINGPVVQTMSLPGRHPAVEKALDGMTVDLHALKEKEMAEKAARNQLQQTVGEAVSHMNDAVAIKQAMAKKEAQLRLEENKLKMLGYETHEIEASHASLLNSLHRVLEPKLMFAKERLLKRERLYEDEDRMAIGWRDKKEQLKQSALELIKGRNAAKENLLQVEEQVAEMKHKEEQARRVFERQRQRTTEGVHTYQYADTKYKAEVEHEKASKESAFAAKESVEKLDSVLTLETRKIDEMSLLRKRRIEEREHTLKAAHEKSEHSLKVLEEQYREWQEVQRKRAAEVVKKSQDTASASEAFANREKEVLDSAQAKVVKEAQSKSDWAWDNDFSQQPGSEEVSQEVSLTD